MCHYRRAKGSVTCRYCRNYIMSVMGTPQDQVPDSRGCTLPFPAHPICLHDANWRHQQVPSIPRRDAPRAWLLAGIAQVHRRGKSDRGPSKAGTSVPQLKPLTLSNRELGLRGSRVAALSSYSQWLGTGWWLVMWSRSWRYHRIDITLASKVSRQLILLKLVPCWE